MNAIGAHDAVARARVHIGIAPPVPVRAWRVRRLDQPADSYYVVEFGDDGAIVAVASVGESRGEVLTWARLPGRSSHLISEAQAVELAGSEFAAQSELVWQPCRATRSLLYPLWEVRLPTKTVYVDQQGIVWTSLEQGGPGG